MVTIVKSNAMSEDMIGLKMIVFGPPGVGKTYFASTAQNVLFLLAEKGGMLGIKDKGIDVIHINKFADLIDAYQFLRKDGHGYKTVVIDSITEVQKKSMDDILIKAGVQTPRMNDWGENIRQISNMCRLFRDLPMNVIFLAHESIEKDEETGETSRRLSVNGQKLPEEIAGFVDCVGYMQANEKLTEDKKKTITVRAIRFGATKKIVCKDRSGKLDIWEEPNFEAIYAKIFGNKEIPEMKAESTDKPKETEKLTTKEVPKKAKKETVEKTESAVKVEESQTTKVEETDNIPKGADVVESVEIKEEQKGTQIDRGASLAELVDLLNVKFNREIPKIKEWLTSEGYKKTTDIPDIKLVEYILKFRTELGK